MTIKNTIILKFLSIVLAILAPLFSLFVMTSDVRSDASVVAAKAQAGGFIEGVCHPKLSDSKLMHEANIGWIRIDVPFPFNDDGSVSNRYKGWKWLASQYVNNGFKIMAVTPYPSEYISRGLDPRDAKNRSRIQEIASFYATDLKDLVGAFQVTNEMGIDRFTLPLTLDEAAEFIGMQLEAMYPVRGNILIGYNLAGTQLLSLPGKMSKWHSYCDYVGLDIYLGCFENILKNADQLITALQLLRLQTRKPIMLCEFGYIGLGEPKSDSEKQQILQSYGYNSEAEARANIDDFIKNLPPELANEFDKYADKTPEYRAQQMFDGEYANHLYKELPDDYGLYGYEHTPEGQARYLKYTLKEVRSLGFVIGSFVYCWSDSATCYICGQEDCPVETKWGLVDSSSQPKPAYYAVKECYAY